MIHDPALTLALALAVGMLCQALARHLRLPGIVLLLGAGVLLGPDGTAVIDPGVLGEILPMLIGFAVAIILFEGGLNLEWRRLRREASSIRLLITLGAILTWAGGALAARFWLEWSWTLSILFGSLVIVTGPTVVQPLLRRIRVKPNVATVLEAEGVLIDAVGAILAVVALEFVVSPTAESGASGLGLGVLDVGARLGLGAILGLIAGGLLALLLRFRAIVPEGLENVFALSWVLVAFQASNAVLHESGLMTVTVAGVVVGNIRSSGLGLLKEFKEQLTVLLIGMLFVLLAADVRMSDVTDLGIPGLLTVLTLMLVVRPLTILACTPGSGLGWREKAFLGWIGPRGIVAAAVASIFANQLAAHDIEGGAALRALVFSVIACTVLVQGLTGGLVARMLGLQRSRDEGYVVLGATGIGLALADLLRTAGNEVIFMDSNPQRIRLAEERGFRVLFGNAMSKPLQRRAEFESRAGVLAITVNGELNLMFADEARHEHKAPRVWVALPRDGHSVTDAHLDDRGLKLLFGEGRALDRWSMRFDRAEALIERWRAGDHEDAATPLRAENLILPLTRHRKKTTALVDETLTYKPGDEVTLAVPEARLDDAHTLLAAHGWERVVGDDAPGDD